MFVAHSTCACYLIDLAEVSSCHPCPGALELKCDGGMGLVLGLVRVPSEQWIWRCELSSGAVGQIRKPISQLAL